MKSEPLTDCCGASFVHPDIDICSECKEHADVYLTQDWWYEELKELEDAKDNGTG